MQAFASPLSQLHTITINGNDIGDVGAQALAQGVRQSRWLTKLWLSDNAVGEAGAVALADAWKMRGKDLELLWVGPSPAPLQYRRALEYLSRYGIC